MPIPRLVLVVAFFVGFLPALPAAQAATLAQAEWRTLPTEAARGKQDDIVFHDASLGWYVSGGAGRIYVTRDGGESWKVAIEKPGTFWRCIASVDDKLVVAGNIGPDYFPNVSDATPLYVSRDGGETWTGVTQFEGPPVKGLCALQVLCIPFVNAGNLDYKVRILGAGRVGGPAVMVWSDDLGVSWHSRALERTEMVLDLWFFDADHGVLAGASDKDVQESHALVLRTEDGGVTWETAFEGERPFELTWKLAFPTRETGYVTIQSYDPDPAASARFFARTTDGGKSWKELPLVDDASVREFGVAFLDEKQGWIGAMKGGFETEDGGASWRHVEMGTAVNKIRVLLDGTRYRAFAIGLGLTTRTGTLERPRTR